MTLSDPIADFITRIRNAKMARHRFLDIRYSKMKTNIARILKENGYIENFLVNEEKHKLRLYLKYAADRKSVIQGLKRVSRPSVRKYVGASDIPRVLGGMGIAILSTPKGVIDGKTARKENVGGELLCMVW